MAKWTQEQLTIINNGLAQVAELEIELEKCKNCGQDITDILATKNELKAKLTRFKTVYFPGEP